MNNGATGIKCAQADFDKMNQKDEDADLYAYPRRFPEGYGDAAWRPVKRSER